METLKNKIEHLVDTRLTAHQNASAKLKTMYRMGQCSGILIGAAATLVGILIAGVL